MNDDFQGLESAASFVPTAPEGFTPPPDDRSRFRDDVLAGLTAPRKTLLSKYFYDELGSRLFERICGLPEYYLTRTETALLRRIAPEIAARIPQGAALVELGSGASTKTRLLLDASPHLRHYVPIDISESALTAAAASIRQDYPSLQVTPLLQDFTQNLDIPDFVCEGPVAGFFPGSTIGNFATVEAIALLRRTRAALGRDARLIVGADLVKDPAVLVRAYDDARGVTAAFNLNLLTRINRELEGTFDLHAFDHRARWNPAESRIEMHLVSNRDQVVFVDGEALCFARGESIHTENSHKYQRTTFANLAMQAGWHVEKMWASAEPAFGIFMLAG